MQTITLEDKDRFDAIGRQLVKDKASVHVRARAVLEVGLEIQRKGWCQLDLAQDETRQCVNLEAPEACRWCMTGAASAAWSYMFRDGFEYARKMVMDRALTILYDAALEVHARGGRGTVASWNDYHLRKEEHVIQAYQAAIRRAA